MPEAQLAEAATADQGVPYSVQHRPEADQGLVPESQVTNRKALLAKKKKNKGKKKDFGGGKGFYLFFSNSDWIWCRLVWEVIFPSPFEF